MNKKLVKIILAVVLCLTVVGGSIAGIVVVSKENKREKLVIYNWADYIAPNITDDFVEYYKAKTGKDIEVVYSMFDTNETMITEITKGDSQIDLICPSEYAIQKLMAKGLIKKLDMPAEKYPYLSNVYPAIREKVDEVFTDIPAGGVANQKMNDYFVPYMWGTLGILYNVDIVTEEDLAEGWGLLWNKAENPKIKGKILMKDSVRDVYAATVVYLKEEGMLDNTPYANLSIEELINKVDETLLGMTEKVLNEQRGHLKGYEVDFGKDDMVNGVAYVDLAWSGDALYAIEESYIESEERYFLDYFVPESGSNIWFDGWAIPTCAQNTGAAKEFINFLCRPDIAMRNMIEIGYTCAVNPETFQTSRDEYNIAAVQNLIENEYVYELEGEREEDGIYFDIDGVAYDMTEFFGDTRRYPAMNTDKLGVMQDFGANNEKVVNMWERVKGGEEFPWQLIVTIVGIVGGVAAIFGIIAVTKRVRGRRQRLPDGTAELV